MYHGVISPPNVLAVIPDIAESLGHWIAGSLLLSIHPIFCDRHYCIFCTLIQHESDAAEAFTASALLNFHSTQRTVVRIAHALAANICAKPRQMISNTTNSGENRVH